jgi:hypothetical protein
MIKAIKTNQGEKEQASSKRKKAARSTKQV